MKRRFIVDEKGNAKIEILEEAPKDDYWENEAKRLGVSVMEAKKMARESLRQFREDAKRKKITKTQSQV